MDEDNRSALVQVQACVCLCEGGAVHESTGKGSDRCQHLYVHQLIS